MVKSICYSAVFRTIVFIFTTVSLFLYYKKVYDDDFVLVHKIVLMMLYVLKQSSIYLKDNYKNKSRKLEIFVFNWFSLHV